MFGSGRHSPQMRQFLGFVLSQLPWPSVKVPPAGSDLDFTLSRKGCCPVDGGLMRRRAQFNVLATL